MDMAIVAEKPNRMKRLIEHSRTLIGLEESAIKLVSGDPIKNPYKEFQERLANKECLFSNEFRRHLGSQLKQFFAVKADIELMQTRLAGAEIEYRWNEEFETLKDGLYSSFAICSLITAEINAVAEALNQIKGAERLAFDFNNLLDDSVYNYNRLETLFAAAYEFSRDWACGKVETESNKAENKQHIITLQNKVDEINRLLPKIADNSAIAAGKKKEQIKNGKKYRKQQLNDPENKRERAQRKQTTAFWTNEVKKLMDRRQSARSAAMNVVKREGCPYKQTYLQNLVRGYKRKQ